MKLPSTRKLLASLGAGALLVGSVFIATVSADNPTPTPNGQATNQRDAFLSQLATNLGVTVDKLKGAITQTETQTIDQAVKDGKLTQQQADNLKQGIAQGKEPFGFFGGSGFGGPGGRGGEAMRVGRGDAVQALANLLKKQPADVMTLMRSGKTLAQILQENNLTEDQVKAEMVSIAQKQLDAAVASGKLTKDQETQALDKIKSAPLNLNGPAEGKGFERRGAGPGPNKSATPAATATKQ